jgi:hypothetical protein
MLEFIEHEEPTNVFPNFPRDDIDTVNYSQGEPLDNKFFHSDHLVLFDFNFWFGIGNITYESDPM